MDGLEMIESIRGWSRGPIIVFSARHESDEKLAAPGADGDVIVRSPVPGDVNQKVGSTLLIPSALRCGPRGAPWPCTAHGLVACLSHGLYSGINV